MRIRLTRRSGVLETHSRSAIHKVIDRAGCPKQFDSVSRFWMVPIDRVSDVEAAAVSLGWSVNLVDGAQLPLFNDGKTPA